MQNAQNNYTEETLGVIFDKIDTLVDKYRNYINEHCPKAYDLSMGEDGDALEIYTPISPDGNADEQLIITLYKKVTGNNADVQIVEALSQYAEKFYDKALSEEEMSFLCENFSAVITYEFLVRDQWLSGYTGQHISEERIRLVKEHVKPEKGTRIFIADTEYCDLAVLFPDCIISGFTGMNFEQKKVWALGQIRLFAAGIQSEIVSGEEVNDEYSYTLPAKGSVDMVIFRVNEQKYAAQEVYGTECKDIEALYDLLKPNGKMLFFSEFISEMAGMKAELYEAPVIDFRVRRTREKAISTIVAYEDKGFFGDKYIMLALCKAKNSKVYIKDEVNSRSKYINSNELDPEILWPNYYWTTRPTNGISLSSIVKYQRVILLKEKELAEFVKGEGWILHENAKNMPLVLPDMLRESYKDANLWNRIVNRVSDPGIEEEQAKLCVAKKPCVLLSSSTEDLRVGYVTEVPDGGFAYMKACCLVPQDGIDVRYIAALLFDPSVKEQILTICEGHTINLALPLVLDKIIVPNHDEKDRLAFLAEANYDALLSSQEELKQEAEYYKKSVRMRKHALTQSLSAIESMFYALNAYRVLQNGQISDDGIISRVKGTSVREAFDFISKNLNDMMPALEHIAAVDYSFDKPEWIDPELFIEDYIKRNENGWLNFKPIMMWVKGHNQALEDIKEPLSGDIILSKGNSICQFLFPKDALERVFNNIISNAQAHGFDNKSRNDYQLRFSWHMEGLALIVEIDNNGSPIANDRDTASLLEYGVSTALHHDGHNGIGCNEIDDIMQRYDGNVKIVSTPEDEFPVKYILTFNRSNTISSL